MSHQHSYLACGLCPDSACISSLPRITSRPSGDLSVHVHADMGIHSLAVPPRRLAAWRINAHPPGPTEGRTPFAGGTSLQGPTGLPAWLCPSVQPSVPFPSLPCPCWVPCTCRMTSFPGVSSLGVLLGDGRWQTVGLHI